MGIKSKEARKYIFNCLDDMMQVKVKVESLFLFFPPHPTRSQALEGAVHTKHFFPLHRHEQFRVARVVRAEMR